MRFTVITIIAVAIGLFIAFVDSRPGWDDTFVTVLTVFAAAFTLAAIAGRRPWLIALAVGLWTPLWEVPMSGNTGALAALVIASVAAFLGWGARKLLRLATAI